jgi:hypothetical protein
MPAHAIRAIPVVTTAVAILILSVGGGLAACAPCGCIPVKACAVAPATLRVEQGPPDYDAMMAALEGPPARRRYPYIRTWYGYPHWWATRILAVGPSMMKYHSHRRCHVCDVAVTR